MTWMNVVFPKPSVLKFKRAGTTHLVNLTSSIKTQRKLDLAADRGVES